jgi:hypothetical protein
MKLSIDQFKNKQEMMFDALGNELSDTLINDDDTTKLTGGDRSAGQPLYEMKHEGIWTKANMLLDNIK